MSEAVDAQYGQGFQYDVMQSSAEMIRQEHIKHESCVQSVGSLYYLGAFFTFMAGCVGFGSGISEGLVENIIAGSIFIVVGIAQGIVAWGLRRLLSWARIPTIILSAIGLVGFPIGTLIHGYIIYLVACKKGAMVFSNEYKDIIEATPHIVYKTSKVVWALLIIIVTLIVLIGLFAALFS